MADLRQRLTDVVQNVSDESNHDLNKNYCALDYGRDCCSGRGFKLEKKGPYIRSSICDCVTGCVSCLGNMIRVDEDGQSRSCKTPSPALISNLFNEAKIPSRYLDSSLAKFENFTGNGESLLSNLAKYTESFTKSDNQGLVISGPVGVGKTYLLASVAKELVMKGVSVKFVDFFQLLAEIKASFSKKESEELILKPLIEVDVLCIDELGKGRNTEFELTIIDQIVMGRYNQDKPIIATTNYLFKDQNNQHNFNVDLTQKTDETASRFSPDVFGTLKNRVGSRIYSRLEECCHFAELSGSDFRKMKANSRGYSF